MVIAGPCSVESREQLLTAAEGVKAAGATLLRGGAYKPRTSPYDFQGLGLEALLILREVSELTGLPVVSEVMSTEDIEVVLRSRRHAAGGRAQHAELRAAAASSARCDDRCC